MRQRPLAAPGFRLVRRHSKNSLKATVVIRDQTLRVEDGHHGEADLHVRADSRTWLGFLAQERKLLWAVLTRRIRLAGSPRHLLAFGKCFLAER